MEPRPVPDMHPLHLPVLGFRATTIADGYHLRVIKTSVLALRSKDKRLVKAAVPLVNVMALETPTPGDTRLEPARAMSRLEIWCWGGLLVRFCFHLHASEWRSRDGGLCAGGRTMLIRVSCRRSVGCVASRHNTRSYTSLLPTNLIQHLSR